jgi:hypothetical protein
MRLFSYIAAAILLPLSVWGCCGLTRHAIELMDAWKDAAPTRAVQNLTAATAQWQAASKAQASSVTAIERDIRAELWHVDRSFTALDSALGTAQTTISTIDSQAAHVGPLLDSAKTAVDGIPPATAAITAAIRNANGGITDLRGFYSANQQSAAQLLANSVTITGTGSHMLTTADQVETKATASYLHPSHNPFKRAWETAEPFIVAGAKITATVF